MEAKLDARIKRSRKLLRDALVSLIQEKGYDRLTVRDITERATVNRSTFYQHYRDKEDLLRQLVKEVLDELRSCFGETEPLPKDGDPAPAFVRMFEHFAQNGDFYRVMLSERGFPRFQFYLENVMRVAMQKRKDLLPPQGEWAVPFDFFLHYISSAHTGMVAWWLQGDMAYSPKYMATQLTRLIRSTAQALR
ncbi:TetR/AcrR family transcriptional regulator [Tumebacillus flagellatus]|uniref:TetR/AcrR family transcriptional regulator n=1 Tax=Tumebacillus flagellatus TaxID=1157490 RepID=UPI00068F702C|nr:TetR/AcrR family transcriptional regulator [Tumebacillus flagellatus]